MARIQKVKEQQQQMQQAQHDLSAKSSKSVTLPTKPTHSNQKQISEINNPTSGHVMPSRPLEPKTNLNNTNNTNNVSYKPVYKQSVSSDLSKLLAQPKPLKESIPPNGMLLQKNDVVGAIMTNINKQSVPNPDAIRKKNEKMNASTEPKYSIDNFISRIVSWRFVWLIEQGI